MGQRDCDVGEVVLTVDDGGECVDGSEAQNQPISVVQRFLTELCKFWSDGWMIRITVVQGKSRKSRKSYFRPEG